MIHMMQNHTGRIPGELPSEKVGDAHHHVHFSLGVWNGMPLFLAIAVPVPFQWSHKAWDMPSLVSVKGLILIFQQAFLILSDGSFPGGSDLLTRVASTSVDLHQFCTGIATKAILQYALVIPHVVVYIVEFVFCWTVNLCLCYLVTRALASIWK